ncbi:MAG: protoporphyrinogen oxidase [Planctomycetes bacterium]|nr:protoporphyrinogen oxidase [Planctomycetota bacterium]
MSDVSAPRVAVVGGGLAGLVCAAELRDRGVDADVFEATGRAGGVVHTIAEGGYQIEWGPQSFLWEAGSSLDRWIQRLRLGVLPPADAARARYVLKDGRLLNLPRELPKLLGPLGLLRASREALGRARVDPTQSVDAFFRARLGPRVADRLLDAFVTGIWAGDPARLELGSAFPRLTAKVESSRSVLRAFFGGGGARRRTASFVGGMEDLPEALAEHLGPAVKLEHRVQSLLPPGSDDRWVLRTADGEAHVARAVVLATSAHVAGTLLAPHDPALGELLAAQPTAPLATVTLGYRSGAFPEGPPEGFGFLAPEQEQSFVLGCLFPSSLFPLTAPSGCVQLRCMVGGRRHPERVEKGDAELVAGCHTALEPLLGITRAPVTWRVDRHREGIPQYELGHATRLRAIDERLRGHPGLRLTGNSYRGISVPDVVADAERVAIALAGSLTA